MKRGSISLVYRKMQIQILVREYFIYNKRAKIKNLTLPSKDLRKEIILVGV